MGEYEDEVKNAARHMARLDFNNFGDDFVLANDAFKAQTTRDPLSRREPFIRNTSRARKLFIDTYIAERKKTMRKKMHMNLRGFGVTYENPAAAISECRKQIPNATGDKLYRCAISRRGLENGPRDRNDRLWIDSAKHLTKTLNGLGGAKKRKRKGKR